MNKVDKIKQLIDECSEPEQEILLKYIRQRILIHPIEKKLSVNAEVILEAIARASDLTLRGIRGIIAEASFRLNVIDQQTIWKDETPPGDIPYDFLLTSGDQRIKVQVKMQRLKAHRPMMAKEGYSFLSSDKFVVETQKTRGGLDSNNNDTRPYRFGEFDILAVSMHPSTGDWRDFLYTVAQWLLPRPDNSSLLLKFQPVPSQPDKHWTNDLQECISWFLSGRSEKIDS
jgi:hypothetical protein